MTYEQFWYDDPNLLEVYERAYYRKIHEEAHIQGYYIRMAVDSALSQSEFFNKKRGKVRQYPKKPIDVFEKYDKQKRTQKAGGVRQEYKQILQSQMSWLNSVSNNK